MSARVRPEGYNSNASRTRQRAATAAAGTTFIGVDGEGWTDSEGVHRYSQLSVGDKTLFGWEHLDFLTILDFLWECFLENPKAAYVGFYLGYDFSQWFRTLPPDRAEMLLTTEGAKRRKRKTNEYLGPFPVEYGGYIFDTLGDKRFKFTKWSETESDVEKKVFVAGGNPWMNICDTGPFFQASFLSVIEPKGWPDGAPATDEEYAIILEGKSHRADDWTVETWLAAEADLTRYNVAENTVLAKVMRRYEEGLRTAGVSLGRDQWYGPGAAAQNWMRRQGLPTAENVRADVPTDVLEFGRESYYGGHFEVFCHGIVPGISYEYDINSAYPAAMAEMPCWVHMGFRWDESSGQTLASLPDHALVDCTTVGSDPVVGSAMHRRKDGTILRPLFTRGVRWAMELRAGIAAGVIDRVLIHRSLSMLPQGCPVDSDEYKCDALITGIPTIYKERLKVGKNTAHGKAFKLIYNSAYGKLAQSIGSPRYSNSLSASFITAHCRTAIMNAIATHPTGTTDLLMIATDGVYFRTPHDSLEISPSELGKWDLTEKSNLTIVMPGVHYDDKGRQAAKDGAFAKLKSRGMPASALAASIAQLDAEFSELRNYPWDEQSWPKMSVPIKFRVQSPKQALAQHKWHTAGSIERDIARTLDTNPKSKRYPPITLFAGMPKQPYLDIHNVIRSCPYEQGSEDLQSYPYQRKFGMEDLDEVFGFSPDGPVRDELNMIFGG